MKTLEPASVPPDQICAMANDLLDKWKRGVPEVLNAFPDAKTEEQAGEQIAAVLEAELNCEFYRNDTHQVQVRRSGDGRMVHLSIKRNDREPIHDWRDLQAIKNQIVGPECEAVELYPAESRLVDTANQFHLWCLTTPGVRFPFGFDGGRCVSDLSIGQSVNRKLKGG